MALCTNLKDQNLKKEELRSTIKRQLDDTRHLPSGPTFISLCRMLSKLCLEAGAEREAVFHLVESHAVSLRHRALLHYYKVERQTTNPSIKLSEMLDKKLMMFGGKYSSDYQGVLMRLREMPPEWTVVQISCVHDTVGRFSASSARLARTPALHVTRMECGPNCEEPFCVTVPAPGPGSTYKPLAELGELMVINRTDKLMGDKHLYWKTRARVDSGIQSLVQFLDEVWLRGWACLLPGRLADEELQARVCTAVDRLVAEETGSTEDLGSRCRRILHCALGDPTFPGRSSLLTVASGATGEGRSCARSQRLATQLQVQRECLGELDVTNRHPVILIIDERLDGLPWEMTAALRGQPVSRVPSLHALHALYKVHKSTICDGYKMVSPRDGFYMVNPGRNLPRMEERMRGFLTPRVPEWKGIVGTPPTTEQFKAALTDSSVFVYMGHGAGTQFLSSDSIEHIKVSATALLFGCCSVHLSSLGNVAEKFGRVLSYHLATSPCVLGMLWEVTDKDTDALAQKLLDTWLPKEAGQDKGQAVEPNLLRAMHFARQEPKQFANSAALVARGLPVKLLLQEDT